MLFILNVIESAVLRSQVDKGLDVNCADCKLQSRGDCGGTLPSLRLWAHLNMFTREDWAHMNMLYF